jgi:hypothetical protein
VYTIDWSLVAAWIQAIALSVAAGVGTWQFIALNRNLKVRNTLTLLDEFSSVRHKGPGDIEMTIAQAQPIVKAAGSQIDAYKLGRQHYYGSTVTALNKAYLRQNTALVLTMNFYINAARLAKRNLMNKDIFLDAQGYHLTLLIEPA